jgi:hypothetical protein
MNAVDLDAIDTELGKLGKLLKTNVELLECGAISKTHYNRNKKIIADRIATLADTFAKVVR